MNRCVYPPQNPNFSGIAPDATRLASRRKALRQLLVGTGAMALVTLSVPAHAGLRVFPMGTKRGRIAFTNPPQVQLDGGKTELLGPGTRIHDAQSNRLVFASTLKGQTFVVNYVRDGNGTIREIWILTPEEIQQKLPPTQEELNRIRQSQNIVPPIMPGG